MGGLPLSDAVQAEGHAGGQGHNGAGGAKHPDPGPVGKPDGGAGLKAGVGRTMRRDGIVYRMALDWVVCLRRADPGD